MTETGSFQSEHRSMLVNYWMEKAHESLLAGGSEYQSGRLTIAVRNLYYACFYALSALLLKQGRSFKKHTGVKAALHKDLVKEGIIEPEWGRFYNKIFDSRVRCELLGVKGLKEGQSSSFLTMEKPGALM